MWTTAATNSEQSFCEPCRGGDCVWKVIPHCDPSVLDAPHPARDHRC